MDNRPATPTIDGLTGRRYHYWGGKSGRAYVHGVFEPAEMPHFANAALIVIAAHRGTRSIIDVAASSDLAQLYFNGRSYKRALMCGANEVHVHLAGSAAEARRIADDISAGLAAADRQQPRQAEDVLA